MYPFGSLPANLAAFCAVLRTGYGFRIGPRQLRDAARALEVVPIGDERAVRHALRPVLAGSVEQAHVFDLAFRTFFHADPTPGPPLPDPRGPDAAVAGKPGTRQREATHDAIATAGTRPEGRADPAASEAAAAAGADEDRPAILRSSYSPLDAEADPPVLGPVDRAWRDAAAALVRRVQAAVSRRWKPARRGARFDLRRTLRSSLHTGGEPVSPRWLARPRLRPRFVVVLDGSRSMSAHVAPALQLAVALASVAAGVEIFVFSTALRRITREVRRAAAGERRGLPGLQHAWGGGTGIGACLRDLVHVHGERLLGRDTVVVIASDGLDVGSPDVLRQAMTELHRRSAAIVWLNPLLDSPGYEPSALGMRIARPFVRTFAWAGDAAALASLSRTVRVA